MKTLKTIILFASILFFYQANSQSVIRNNSDNTDLVSSEFLNQIIEAVMQNQNISGLSACIIKGDKEVWKGNFGLANRETNLEVNDSTTFLLYSISKTFAGIALMQLHEKDSFDLDDPINDYLPFQVVHPDYPDTDITFRMLMCHISGILDYWSVLGPMSIYNQDTPIGIAEFLENYLLPGGAYYYPDEAFSNYQPGTAFTYSNVGGTLAGYLIEVMSQQPFHVYIEDNILLPLQMDRSKYYQSQSDTSNMAVKYYYSGGQYHALGFMSSPMIPAGFLHSTRDDMSNYLKMLIQRGTYDGNYILDSTLFETMITEQYPTIAPNAGLLFTYDHINNLWGHYGGSGGVKTVMLFDKEEDWGVVVLSNGGGQPFDIADLLYRYARDYKSISLIHAEILDQDDDLILEPNEAVSLELDLRSNMLEDISNVDVTLSTNCNYINIVNPTDNIPFLAAGEETISPLNFQFELLNFPYPMETELVIYFSSDNVVFDSTILPLYLGDADILLVCDEEHIYKNRNHAEEYYKDALIENNMSVRLYDINLLNFPDYTFFQEFNAVMWYTGLDNEVFYTIMTDEEQQLIADYLDNDGKLFMSSQNVSDDIGQTSFFHNYLKAEEINAAYSGPMMVNGINGNPIGADFTFNITGGTGSGITYSASIIEPVNGSEKAFTYYNSEDGAGITYDGEYKLVFLPYCFSSVSSEDKRSELMLRILDFFNLATNMPSYTATDVSFNIYPNPTIDKVLNIHSETEGSYSIGIYDFMGKIVYKDFIKTDKSLNLDYLPSGNYILKIYSDSEVFTQKIVIL